jgi:hypothetical protein
LPNIFGKSEMASTNIISGLTGRDGHVWVPNLPLNPGTNTVGITVTTPVGSTTTNITLVQSAVSLTINQVLAGDTLVTGGMDTGGYTIWVNGIKATDNGDGTWSAEITPIGIGGGLVLVTAIPNTDNGGNGSGGGPGVNPTSANSINAEAVVNPPQGVYVSAYHYNVQQTFLEPDYYPVFSWTNELWSYVLDWQDGQGGTESGFFFVDWLPYEPASRATTWPTNHWPQALTNGFQIQNVDGENYTNLVDPPALPGEHCDTFVITGSNSERRTADTEMKLATGGPLGSTQKNLWCITATATDADTGLPIPPEQLQIGNLGTLDTNGELWVLLPDNDPLNVTVKPLEPIPHYRFNVSGNYYPLSIAANQTHLYEKVVANGADFCVGQAVYFNIVGLNDIYGQPLYLYDATAKWTVTPDTFVNRQPDPNCLAFYDKDDTKLSTSLPRGYANGGLTTCVWFYNDNSALPPGVNTAMVSVDITYKVKSGGTVFPEHITGKFNVHRPSVINHNYGTPELRFNPAGSKMTVGAIKDHDMRFQHQIRSDTFSGYAGYIQLVGFDDTTQDKINTESPLPPYHINLHPSDNLDTLPGFGVFPRGTQRISANDGSNPVNGWPDYFYDSPAVFLPVGDTPATYHVHFHDYLMFQPDAEPGPNIFVPLQEIDWKVWASGNRSSNQPDKGSAATITHDDSCTTFPYWDGNVDLNADQPDN